MEEMDRKVVELYQEMARGQGINDPLMMEIFARVYMEPEPIAMEDIAKKTGYSLASISNKVKLLAPVMGIKRVKKPGSKKLFLYMEKNIFKIWKNALLKKEKYVVDFAKERMPSIIQEYKKKSKTDYDKKKAEMVENYYSQILKFEKLLKVMITEFGKLE